MSLRPEISGFKLDILLSLFGSRNREAAANAAKVVEETVAFDDPREFARVRQVLEQAITSGRPFADLTAEDGSHVYAALGLAAVEQNRTETESNVWKMGAFEDLVNQIGTTIEPKALTLLRYFLDGRPLFGKTIQADWSYYAWLSLDELKTLIAALRAVAQTDSDPTGDGFLEELTGWLDQVAAADSDLWFFAS